MVTTFMLGGLAIVVSSVALKVLIRLDVKDLAVMVFIGAVFEMAAIAAAIAHL